ncbi:MAG: hypothetical protein AAGI63_18600, partial [Planctomycetota bacterium]
PPPPPRPKPITNKRPGEYAGDCIVAAANYILEIGKPDQWQCANRCLDSAYVALSHLLAERTHEDSEAPICQMATDRLTQGIVTHLESIPIEPM